MLVTCAVYWLEVGVFIHLFTYLFIYLLILPIFIYFIYMRMAFCSIEHRLALLPLVEFDLLRNMRGVRIRARGCWEAESNPSI